MLDPFAQLFQYRWGHARSLRMDYKDLWVLSFPRCTEGPNIAESCCIRWHTTANKHATTPNIVGTTMLGVVASVCTQPNKRTTTTTGFSQSQALRDRGGDFKRAAWLLSQEQRPSVATVR